MSICQTATLPTTTDKLLKGWPSADLDLQDGWMRPQRRFARKQKTKS